MADLTDRELLRIAEIGVNHLLGGWLRMQALRCEERASPADVALARDKYVEARAIVRAAAAAIGAGQPAQGGGNG